MQPQTHCQNLKKYEVCHKEYCVHTVEKVGQNLVYSSAKQRIMQISLHFDKLFHISKFQFRRDLRFLL